MSHRAGEEECKYYKKNLDCAFGGSCKFHHPELTVDWMPMHSPTSASIPPTSIPQHPELRHSFPLGYPLGMSPPGTANISCSLKSRRNSL